MIKNGQPSGIEIDLITKFAESLEASPEWFFLSMENAVVALDEGQLDLVIGGITDTTPWKNQLSLTRPYYTETYSIGIFRKNADLENVAIYPADWLFKYVRKEGYTPLEMEDPFSSESSVAAADWELIQHGYTPKIRLHVRKKVMAVRMGENRFLITLESFLKKEKKSIPELL